MRIGGIPIHRKQGMTPLRIIGRTRLKGWWEPWRVGGAYVSNTGAGDRAFMAGDQIGFITDLSGNGSHLTQSSGSACPIIAANVFGRLPAARFDGIDDVVATSSQITFAAKGYYINCFVLRTALSNGTLCCAGLGSSSGTFVRIRPRITANTPTIEQRNASDTMDAIRFTGVNVALDTPYYQAIGSTGSAYDGQTNGVNPLTKTVNTGADNGEWAAACVAGLTNYAIGAHATSSTILPLEVDWGGGCVIDGDCSAHELTMLANYFRFAAFDKHLY